VQVFAPDGKQVDEIELPGAVNFVFADSTLLITTDTAIWAAELSAKGA
jgi:sugar lactone lactonase YvrE